MLNIFDDLVDSRESGKVIHELHDILILSLCAVLSGAEDFEAIHDYGRQKIKFLKQFIKLANGIPSISTINRTFRYLDTKEFQNCLMQNVLEIAKFSDKYLVNIDGKILRGTGKKGKKNDGICIVTAWAQEQNLVLGQVRVDEKSNEKTAIPILLETLDLDNAILSIDAIACTDNIAKPIIDGGGDYIIAVKSNKKGLEEEVRDWLNRPRPDFDIFHKTDYVGGRIEEQTCIVCLNLQHLCQEDLLWGSKSIIKVKTKRTIGIEIQEEARYYISSLAVSAQEFSKLIRNHWSIENQLHWHLDISFNEDKCRTRKDNGAENMNILRKIALQFLKNMKDKRSVKGRRQRAGWNDEYLVEVLEMQLS